MKTLFNTLVVLNILVPCSVIAQWSAAVNISPKAMAVGLNENMGPCLAVSNDTVHVIWSDTRTKGQSIYYTRSTDNGKTFSNAVALTDTTGKASMPSIAVSGKNIHIVWWDNVLTTPRSFYIHSLDGGTTWSSPACIDTNTVFWPGVAVHGSTVLVSLNKGVFGATIVCLTISSDNGTTWGAEQTISTRTGTGRSEDQSTATDGNFIHMCWNDNRSGQMQTYYRRSTNMGLSWDNEVALTTLSYFSYTPMVCIDSGHVEVAHSMRNGVYNVWFIQSADSGKTWNADQQVTTGGELYPYMVRDGMNLYMSCAGGKYHHSVDGGATWDTLNTGGGQSFIALACPVLHMIYSKNSAVYYMQNPTADPSCSTTFNLKLYIQGFYLGSGLMTPVLKNQGVSSNSNVVDTVTVSLVDSATLTVKQTATGVLQTNGALSVSFPGSVAGNKYYLKINHRNAVETWSANSVTMSNGGLFDFTTGGAKAYGSNEAADGDGTYSFYSGDINQDGGIDGTDFLILDPDIIAGKGGYLATDLNGDGGVDSADFLMLYPNIKAGRGTFHP